MLEIASNSPGASTNLAESPRGAGTSHQGKTRGHHGRGSRFRGRSKKHQMARLPEALKIESEVPQPASQSPACADVQTATSGHSEPLLSPGYRSRGPNHLPSRGAGRGTRGRGLKPVKLPSRFHLGGNIRDPLNLDGVATTQSESTVGDSDDDGRKWTTDDDDHQRDSEELPIRLPKNPTDPLNLLGESGGGLVSRTSRGGKRKRNRQKAPNADECSPVTPGGGGAAKRRRSAAQQPSVSDSGQTGTAGRPEARQTPPTPRRKPPAAGDKRPSRGKAARQQPAKKKRVFPYGNYNQYYGYRNEASHRFTTDPRLQLLPRDWFGDADVLDIGCNIGHVTLLLARGFPCRHVTGIDIDPALISIARKNVRHYMDSSSSSAPVGASESFPSGLRKCFGPLSLPTVLPSGHGGGGGDNAGSFPRNVSFVRGNYVLDCDAELELERPQFDVILALSVSKWVHLNWGDAGLCRFFQRAFRQLRPGGRFILEPQPWSSYVKKKSLTSAIASTFRTLSLRPDSFPAYLTSIGFSQSEQVGVPEYSSKGFRRPILVFQKPTEQQMESAESSNSLAGAAAAAVVVDDS